MSLISAEQQQALRKELYQATLVSKRMVHDELAIFRVQPDAPLPPHKAGQYTTLGLGVWERSEPNRYGREDIKPGEETRLIRRQYSISHPVLNESGDLFKEPPEYLEFFIVLVSGQEQAEKITPTLTPRLFALQPGDRLFLGEKIIGHYTLDGVQPDDTILLFSTGTGEAPNNYLLWDLLRQQHRGPILAATCVRHARDLGYLALHQQLMQRYSHYHYMPLMTREPGQPKRYLQDLLTSGDLEKQLQQSLDPKRTHVYLCGNPQMIGVPAIDRGTRVKTYPQPVGMVQLLEERGLTADAKALKIRGNIHFEEYW